MDDVPTVTFLEGVAQAVTGNSVLQYAQLNRKTGAADEAANQCLQHLALPPQVQRTACGR